MNRVKNKIVLVTGGARGIGAVTAKLLAREGAKVIVTDILEKEGRAVAESINADGKDNKVAKDNKVYDSANNGCCNDNSECVSAVNNECGKDINNSAVFYYLDVSDENNWRDVIEKIKTNFGRLDILVNNAGITGFATKTPLAQKPHNVEVFIQAENENKKDTNATNLQDPENTTLDSWHEVHRVNLDGVFLGCKYSIGLMKENFTYDENKKQKSSTGSIINISSRSGMIGVPGAAAYASSKAAIRNHTKTVALYCAEKGYNIRCNSIHPGAILTEMWEEMFPKNKSARDALIESIAQDIPLRCMGEPLDVAYMVLYLASDESKYVTGAEFTIDGGILAGSAASVSKKD